MTFEELINTKVNEILNNDKEYQALLKDKVYLMGCIEKFNEVFDEKPSFTRFGSEKNFGFKYYADIVTFHKTFEEERAKLETRIKKSIFGKQKLREELSTLLKKYQYAEEVIALYEDKEKAKDVYEENNSENKIKNAERKAVRQVLVENRNEEVVEDAFMNSLRKDGCTNMGRYSSNLFASVAYDIIDEEVQKLLKKTKYREKLDDLKSQLTSVEADSEGEKE